MPDSQGSKRPESEKRMPPEIDTRVHRQVAELLLALAIDGLTSPDDSVRAFAHDLLALLRYVSEKPNL